MTDTAYPFVPKSTRLLKRGQFWALPLGEAEFGAACVVGLHMNQGKPSQRAFIAGVVRWFGTSPPTAEQLRGLPIAEFAFAHLKAITESGGSVLGEAELQFGLAPSAAEALALPMWGYHVPLALARRLAENAV